MWTLTNRDLDDGAQEKVVAASDFRGPKKAVDRQRTNFACVPLLLIAILYCGFCVIAPSIISDPNSLRLLEGTDYAGLIMSMLLMCIRKPELMNILTICPSLRKL